MVCLQVLTFSYTGLPTNNEPSEKTVRNLHCLFVSLYSWFKFLSFFVKSVEHIQGRRLNLTLGAPYLNFMSSLQSHFF